MQRFTYSLFCLVCAAGLLGCGDSTQPNQKGGVNESSEKAPNPGMQTKNKKGDKPSPPMPPAIPPPPKDKQQ